MRNTPHHIPARFAEALCPALYRLLHLNVAASPPIPTNLPLGVNRTFDGTAVHGAHTDLISTWSEFHHLRDSGKISDSVVAHDI